MAPRIWLKEVWKDIPGYEGFYQASNKGRIRGRHWLILDPTIHNGYPQVNLKRKASGGARSTFVHRLVLEAFRGKRKVTEEARHLNGNRLDCRIKNLSWGTRIENAQDRVRHGTQARGEDSPKAKLTGKQVIAIRKAYKNGAKQKELAEKYGVKQNTISFVVRNVTWVDKRWL